MAVKLGPDRVLAAGAHGPGQRLPVSGGIGHNGLAGGVIHGGGEVFINPALHHHARSGAAYARAIAIRKRAGINIGQHVIGIAGRIAGAGEHRVLHVVIESRQLHAGMAHAARN